MPKSRIQNRFAITLFENGMHSLRKGIQAYKSFDTQPDVMLLKDAIMHLHHGIELLMKEILIRHNSFLIFEDLRDVAKKQKQADKLETGIFFIERPPKTVSFEDAVARVEAFVKPQDLTENLTQSLEKLNRLRNQLEHYAIDADRDEITKVLGELQEPLLKLFESTLGDISQLREAEIKKIWNNARAESKAASQYEKRIFDLMGRFDGRKVAGMFFSVKGELDLPIFRELIYSYALPNWPSYPIDIYGIADNERWAVEVKGGLGRNEYGISRLIWHKDWSRKAGAKPWFVALNEVSQNMRRIAESEDILLSDEDDILELDVLLSG